MNKSKVYHGGAANCGSGGAGFLPMDRIVDPAGTIIVQSQIPTTLYAAADYTLNVDGEFNQTVVGDTYITGNGVGGVGVDGGIYISSNNSDVAISALAAGARAALVANIINIEASGAGRQIFLKGIKNGATQAGCGAVADEIWRTQGHASLPNGVLMIGL